MAPKFGPDFVPSLAKFQISQCCAVGSSPYSRCPSVEGAAVTRSALNPPPLAGVSWTLHKVGPKFGRVSLPYPPPAPARVPTLTPPAVACGFQAPSKLEIFDVFFPMIFWKAKKTLFGMIFGIPGRPGVDFPQFWVSKWVPRDLFFGVLWLFVFRTQLCIICSTFCR